LFAVCDVAEKMAMTFNTTSYIAGVGSVVAVLSTGFAGGYFLANPTRIDPPNRLQRLAAEDHTAPATAAVKPEVVTAATPAPAAAPVTPAPAAAAAAAIPAPQPLAQQPTVQQAAAPPIVAPAEAKAPEPVRTVATQETIAPTADKVDTDRVNAQKASADKARADGPKLAERKRSEATKVAEQQRKQRELEVATVAVRRIIHGRDAPDMVIRDRDAPDIVENDPPEGPAPEAPHFNLFGQ
jgi:type IV secretory pathway VirB10-like protein